MWNSKGLIELVGGKVLIKMRSNMIDKLLNTYRNEVAIATDAYFTLKSINVLASNDSAILRGLNESARPWNIITHSLQCTYFMAIGRIFDIDDDSFSVHKLLRSCMDEINLFSKQNLRLRKSCNGSKQYDWLDKYVDAAYEPEILDFQKLRGEVSKQHKKYEVSIKPIRHKLFAHKDYGTLHSIDTLFEKTSIDEVESVLSFLFQLGQVIFQLWENGKLKKLSEFSLDEEKHIKLDVEKLLAKVSA